MYRRFVLLVWARETNSVAAVVRDDSTDDEFVRPRLWARLARFCFARGASGLGGSAIVPLRLSRQ
jgi:hypothetical protein